MLELKLMKKQSQRQFSCPVILFYWVFLCFIYHGIDLKQSHDGKNKTQRHQHTQLCRSGSECAAVYKDLRTCQASGWHWHIWLHQSFCKRSKAAVQGPTFNSSRFLKLGWPFQQKASPTMTHWAPVPVLFCSSGSVEQRNRRRGISRNCHAVFGTAWLDTERGYRPKPFQWLSEHSCVSSLHNRKGGSQMASWGSLLRVMGKCHQFQRDWIMQLLPLIEGPYGGLVVRPVVQLSTSLHPGTLGSWQTRHGHGHPELLPAFSESQIHIVTGLEVLIKAMVANSCQQKNSWSIGLILFIGFLS